MFVQKKTADSLSNVSISGNTTIDIPNDLDLNNTVVNLDLRNNKNNPYSTMTDDIVLSDILSFSIKDADGNKIPINNTMSPFVLKMNVKRVNGVLPVTSCKYWDKNNSQWSS